jgi:tetratricopeptide (TPR) repeat protein
MQDEIVSRLANTLKAQLIAAEARRAERLLQPSSLDLYFRGMACWNKSWTPGHMRQARGYFERALELDAENVDALVGIAAIDTASAVHFIVDDAAPRLRAAEAALVNALSLDPQHALAHMFLGCVQCCTGRAAQGVAECEHALALNWNLAEAHSTLGAVKYLDGRPIETEAHIQEALRLSPLDEAAHRWMSYVALAKLQLGADAEAIMWLRRSLKTNTNYPWARFILAATLSLSGELDEARAAAKAGLALDPGFTTRRLKASPFSGNEQFRAAFRRIIRGMHLAGIPER